MNLEKLSDNDLGQLIENRWNSSSSLWETLTKAYERNTKYYDCSVDGENVPEYIRKTPIKKHRVRSNRIFTNVEAVINALIANPPKVNIIPTRNTAEAKDLAQLQEQYFLKKYDDLNIKEHYRKGLRNLYFARLIVLKPFWNPKINDFDVLSIDPRKVRFSKTSTKEIESEFAIEEVEDDLENLIAKFPDKEGEILSKSGIQKEKIAITNPSVTYKEAWVGDYLCVKYHDLILFKGKNPYWDWDGIKITAEEEQELQKLEAQERRIKMEEITAAQAERIPTQENQEVAQSLQAYYFNHFDEPRKPYIFATVLNNENTPIGRTDFIEQAIPLQESLDRRKRQIDDNAQMMNGITKVDSSVMDKSDAQKLRYETEGIIWGKGVKDGVSRETGVSLPPFIFEDLKDSRDEIDNIMAATSAFRGEREGQETKAGRIALIEQSFLRLNELVQVVDYVSYELFNWLYHLAKLRYTERHYAKTMGVDNAIKTIELTRNDFEDGTEVKVIPGKTLPEDKRFRFERAQADVANGFISPLDYLQEAGYNNPKEIAKNAELYKLNPSVAAGVTPEEMQPLLPPVQTPQVPEDQVIQ